MNIWVGYRIPIQHPCKMSKRARLTIIKTRYFGIKIFAYDMKRTHPDLDELPTFGALPDDVVKLIVGPGLEVNWPYCDDTGDESLEEDITTSQYYGPTSESNHFICRLVCKKWQAFIEEYASAIPHYSDMLQCPPERVIEPGTLFDILKRLELPEAKLVNAAKFFKRSENEEYSYQLHIAYLCIRYKNAELSEWCWMTRGGFDEGWHKLVKSKTFRHFIRHLQETLLTVQEQQKHRLSW